MNRRTWIAMLSVLAGCGGGLGGKTQTIADVDLLVTPSEVTFGSIPVGQEDSKQVELRHTGGERPIKIKGLRLETDSNEGVFSVDGPADTELAPGESTYLVIHYRPTLSNHQDKATLYIDHDIPGTSSYKVVRISTLGGFAELETVPSPIDFGDVEVGKEVPPMDVKVRNAGTQPVTVNTIALEDQDSDFAILGPFVTKDGGQLPVTLDPKDEIGLVIAYTPHGADCPDQTNLVVTVAGRDMPYKFEVLGCELAPRLVASPGVVDFGYVQPGEQKAVKVSLANEGQIDLRLDGIGLTPGTDDQVKVLDAPAPGYILTRHDAVDVTVTWTGHAHEGDTLGGLEIKSNDPTSPLVLPVLGVVDAPQIALVPDDVVDFGFVAYNIASSRTLVVRNDGHGVLKVSDVKIEGDALGEFSMADADKSFEVEGYGTYPIQIVFKTKGQPGEVKATMKVLSNDAARPEASVILKAMRADKATCEPVLTPPGGLNFGMVAMGYSKTLAFTLTNKGTGNCTFLQARIVDCMGMSVPGFPTTCGDPFAGGGISSVFKVISTPPMMPNGLGPGQSGTISVRFTPPASPSIWQGMFDSYYGRLGVKVRDENVGDGQPKPEIVVPPATSTNPNLVGQGGMAKVAVLPGEVKFGLTTIGCYSKTYKVCVHNTGNAPLEVSEISLAGCSPEFKLKNVPALPANVTAGKPVCFETVYVPQEVGEKQCVVQIKSSDTASPSLVVGLSGAGTYDTEQTDEFVQVSGQDVDVLFVIDDSGSMCEEQDRLVQNFDDFIKNAAVWNNNYHIGVISVNVVNQAVMGKLNRGDPKITPRFITPNPNAGSQFAKLAKLGCEGGSDEQEAGLEASQIALSAPLTTDTGVKCASDADCQNDKTLCGDPKKCPYYCNGGTCGGWNAGFMRPDAQLEIVVLSDEEDQSSAAPTFYIDFLKSIKGYYNANMMHFNSIVGVDTGGGGCTAADGATAEAAKRYQMVSQETNGVIGSICDMDFSKTMNDIGKVAFGLKVQFFLTRLADPPTVKVWVDGVECKSGWQYDAPSNSVIFDDKGACMPQPGQKIKVHYKTLCLSA